MDFNSVCWFVRGQDNLKIADKFRHMLLLTRVSTDTELLLRPTRLG